MADEREEEMLEMLRDVQRQIRQLTNTVNEIWAEWTRLHKPTIDRSGPHEHEAPRKVKRVLR
jgi:hypothetical protein